MRLLLDTIGTNQSEKDAIPNLTLGGFEIIDDIKKQVEQACPGIVSCADILALAARDAVSFPFRGNLWEVPTGRKDGRESLLSNVNGNLPSPFSDFRTLQEVFDNKNLNVNDLVALSGKINNLPYNFTGKGDMDPSLNATYAETLKQQCPINSANPSTTVEMDPQSSLKFDTNYFKILNQNKGLFQSDAALLRNADSAAIVNRLKSPGNFFFEFGRSMVKMGNIEVLTGNAGEITKNCELLINP
ncbi:hypothetical protein ACH5RR_033418 [Cinchona calisaya]|uniref:peroxidase n=1 Tax=Cinchona calisaya TaxID=153742 RepID=A0ABD2YM86_9GENT